MATTVCKLGESERERRWKVFSVFVYAYRVRERQPNPPYHSLARADRFQAGLSPLSVISLCLQHIFLRKIHLSFGPRNNKWHSIRQEKNHAKNLYFRELTFLRLLYLVLLHTDMLISRQPILTINYQYGSKILKILALE